mmetsp:Transcript_10256/g.30454  ORF Transcript_10256/g.30454 Transcript_10256/m.30454 type:complete len:364 (+) Transcript_10256:1397-2488(+)
MNSSTIWLASEPMELTTAGEGAVGLLPRSASPRATGTGSAEVGRLTLTFPALCPLLAATATGSACATPWLSTGVLALGRSLKIGTAAEVARPSRAIAACGAPPPAGTPSCRHGLLTLYTSECGGPLSTTGSVRPEELARGVLRLCGGATTILAPTDWPCAQAGTARGSRTCKAVCDHVTLGAAMFAGAKPIASGEVAAEREVAAELAGLKLLRLPSSIATTGIMMSDRILGTARETTPCTTPDAGTSVAFSLASTRASSPKVSCSSCVVASSCAFRAASRVPDPLLAELGPDRPHLGPLGESTSESRGDAWRPRGELLRLPMGDGPSDFALVVGEGGRHGAWEPREDRREERGASTLGAGGHR